MPHNYAPTATRLTVVPSPDDGDARTAASVNQSSEALGDGVEWASAQLDVLADLAALTAITSPPNGMTRYVVGHGLFTFQTSATTGLAPFRLAADDLTAGGWVAGAAHQTTVTRYVSCGEALRGMPTAANAPSIISSWRPLPQASSVVFSAGGFIVQVASTHATNAWGFYLPISKYLIDGAVLSSLTLRYEPANAGADPTVFPQIAIGRDSRGGSTGAIDQLNSGGFVIDSGGTYQFGTVRNLVYTPDQANTIDLDSYDYFVVIYDEHGTNAVSGNNFIHMAIEMTSILDARR